MKKKRARTSNSSSGSKKASSRLAKKRPAARTKNTSSRSSISRKKVQARKTVRVRLAYSRKRTQLPARQDLPFSYNKTQLVLLVRDTEWAYAYWDFSGETWKWMQSIFKRDPAASAKLRIHNLDAGTFFDIDVSLDAKNWYVCLGIPNTQFQAELGILDSQGRFHSIVKSNRVRTPRNRPSDNIDPKWVPENFDELYNLSGGGKLGRGSEFFSHFTKKRP